MYGNPYYNQTQPRYQSMNPMGQQMPTQPYMQPIIPTPTPQQTLLGKVVESIDVVKAMDIPLDGSVSYYPLSDGSCIVSKQLQNDGTSKTIVYKAVELEKVETPKYATMEDVEKAIENIDFSDIDDIKEDVKEIKKQLKDMRKGKGE